MGRSMKETLFAIFMVGLAFATPLAVALIIVASDENISYTVGAGERDYFPHYEEEAYLNDY